MSTAESQEPEIIREGKRSWLFAIGIALLIVLFFWAAGQVNNRVEQPWSVTTGPPEGNTFSGRGTVAIPPGPGGGAMPASPAASGAAAGGGAAGAGK